MKQIILAAALLSTSAVSFAQDTAVPPVVPVMAVTTEAAPNILARGATMQVRFLNELTTEERGLHVGDRVRLEVIDPVMVNGVIVIPAGTPVTGELTRVRNKGNWGRSGAIEGRLVSALLSNGRTLRVTGTFNDRGVTGTAGVVASVVLIPLAGFFVTGTSARIAAGSQTTAYLDEDISFTVGQPAPPTPVAVATPAALAPVTAQVSPQ